MRLILRWLASAVALLAVAYVIPQVVVDSFIAAAIAALAIGLINAILGRVLHLLTKPLTCMTLGLFALVVNAFLFWLASEVVPGFEVTGLIGALLGSILYGLIAGLITALIGKK
ncbi:phage holin family protein [soil metagenome]